MFIGLAKQAYQLRELRILTAAGYDGGALVQTMLHLLFCPLSTKNAAKVTSALSATDDAIEMAKFCANYIYIKTPYQRHEEKEVEQKSKFLSRN